MQPDFYGGDLETILHSLPALDSLSLNVFMAPTQLCVVPRALLTALECLNLQTVFCSPADVDEVVDLLTSLPKLRLVAIGEDLSSTSLRFAALLHSVDGSAAQWAELPRYHPRELDVNGSAPVAPLGRLPHYKQVSAHETEAALAVLRASQGVTRLQVRLSEPPSRTLIDELALECVQRGVSRLQISALHGRKVLPTHPLAEAGWVAMNQT